ncbi:MAG: NAD(P)/FAD-dependent oxidoreductase [Clostridia bacterium]|nr:NAD(P)/FAD-dependent oxidoreductase [Clostridia bacterium]
MSKDVIVIGAGAAGLLAAGLCAAGGNRVTVLEKNDRPGKKLAITGKGRCNVTNNCTLVNELMENIPGNGRFLYSAFAQYMPSDVMDLFESLGVPLKTERGNRVFPVSDNAHDIVDALVRFAKDSGAKIRLQTPVAELLAENGCVQGVRTETGDTFSADAVIVATGGVSYPLTGSTGDGYRFAEAAGHTVVPPRPSLVPLETEDMTWRRAQGLTLKNVGITVTDARTYKEVYSDFGELLFTHFGVSGPVILSASAHLRDFETRRYVLHIDLKPALSPEKLDARILRDFSEFSNRTLPNALHKLLPASLIPVITELSGISNAKQVNRVTREERQRLGELLKDLSSPISGPRPIAEAVVTAGGVNVREVDPKTMQSKKCKGLYFAGEVLDVDAYTGGFNLQIAFSTAAAAAKALQSIIE